MIFSSIDYSFYAAECVPKNNKRKSLMKKRYNVFITIQLIWSVFACVWVFVNGRNSADKAPESLFIIGAIVMGTILFVNLQPMLKQQKSSSTARMILVIGYVVVFTANLQSLKERFDLLSISCLILSIAGISGQSSSAHLNNKRGVKTVFFLLLLISLVCSVGGNIALICGSDISMNEKIIILIMLVVLIIASIILLLFKNQSAGIIHLCALIISSLSLESPFMYVLILLIVAEFITVYGKYSIYTSD